MSARFGAKTLAAATLAAAAVIAAPATAALASPAPAAAKPVVVGGLLEVFGFGTGIGLPLGCQLGTAALGSGAAYLNKAQQVSPAINEANTACSLAAAEGTILVNKAQANDTKLNALNPFVNPMIGEVANSVTQVGTNYGPALAPFGPTIAGLGGTLNFFQGS